MGLLHEALPASTLVIAIDPGKVSNQVWLSTGEAGAVVPPLSLPVLRPGLDQLQRLVMDHAGTAGPVFAIEATGGLHRAWVRELNQRFPRSVRLFAPSETAAPRAQLGSRRFKTDDRAALDLERRARGVSSVASWPQSFQTEPRRSGPRRSGARPAGEALCAPGRMASRSALTCGAVGSLSSVGQVPRSSCVTPAAYPNTGPGLRGPGAEVVQPRGG